MAKPARKTSRKPPRKVLSHPERAKRRAEIARLVKGGMLARDAAKKFDVSVFMVWRSCKEHRVDPITKPTARRKAIAEAARRGASAPELVRRFGVSGDTIAKACRLEGVRLSVPALRLPRGVVR